MPERLEALELLRVAPAGSSQESGALGEVFLF
jgi:hypothetical protein